MPTFDIYEIKRNGTAELLSRGCEYATPEQALEDRRVGFPTLYLEGGRFIVLDRSRNPRGAQVVFTLTRGEAPLRAVPAVIG